MLGTLINIAAVIVGSLLGTLLRDRFSARMRETILHGVGLVTLALGIHLTLETGNILVVLGSVLLGAIIGEVLQIDLGLERMGEWLQRRVTRKGASPSNQHFVEGFVTASLVFCIGPVTILGAIQDGMSGDYTLLAVKSTLDGFTSLAFASSLGIGVLFAIIPLFVYQGGLSLLAGLAASILTEAMIAEMTATGGILILAIGLLLLDIKRIRVANMLPALVIAPLIVAILAAMNVSGF